MGKACFVSSNSGSVREKKKTSVGAGLGTLRRTWIRGNHTLIPIGRPQDPASAKRVPALIERREIAELQQAAASGPTVYLITSSPLITGYLMGANRGRRKRGNRDPTVLALDVRLARKRQAGFQSAPARG
jgi:hypothetical protein